MSSGTNPVGRKRLLLSLEMAALGHSGIPQESRLLAKAFVHSDVHEVSGLLMEARNQFTAHVGGSRSPDKSHAVLSAANYLLGLSGFEAPGGGWRRRRLASILWRLYRVYVRGALGYAMQPMPQEMFRDTVWRRMFALTLPASDKSEMDELSLYFSQMTLADLHRSLTPFAPTPSLDTSGFDAVLFHDCRPIRVRPGTAKFIRYHDTIPISEPDLMGEGLYTSIHHAFIRQCRTDSWFVCNSKATRDSLVKIFPDLEDASVVIPNVISPALDPIAANLSPWEIVSRRRASYEGVKQAPSHGPLPPATASYLIAVATLEPKKNISGLIAAWERLREMVADAPRLVLVGSLGWNYANDLRSLAPHLASGNAFHLEAVPVVELQALYRNAILNVFPSFAEGFGYPPVEALVSGTPSVISDLPALRETMGDAAVYIDPFDPDSIARGMISLIGPDAEGVRSHILAQRDQRIERHSPDRISRMWNNLVAQTPPRSADARGRQKLESFMGPALTPGE